MFTIPAERTITYASITEDLDLYAIGEWRFPIRVRIGGAGTLHIVDPRGRENTITYSAGDVDCIMIRSILADSTATEITVYW